MQPSWGPVAAATAVAWAGALAAARLRGAGSRVMQPLIYAALLFFGASALFDIQPDAKAALSWPAFLLSAAAGYAAFWAIGRYIAPICPACAMRTLERDHGHTHGAGRLVLAAVLAVHCLLDGLGVSAASTFDPALGWRVFAAITVHKLPEGFALALMLMLAGEIAWRAFLWTAAIETATLAGALAGAWWPNPSSFWLSLVLAHIGGTFLYLSVAGLRDAISTPRRLVVAGL